MTTFKKLGLSDEVLKALSDLGFERPSDIQQKAIPQLLTGSKDFIGLAQTGTGKTAAFGLPLLELVDPFDNYTQALILAPTRELGQQISEQLNLYSKYQEKLNILPVYGGAPIVNQMKALKKTQHIIIATPGRLIDLIKRKAVNLEQLEVIVLDEADEMLNMGFKEELDEILSFTPKSKLTWLFSATMPNEIKRIVNKYMDNPVEVRIDQQDKVNTNIEHQYAVIKQSNKTEALTRFLESDPNMRGIIFCRTKRDTQELAEELLAQNIKADAIHGDLSQPQRDRVMNRFKAHDLQILVATDVAARGIDVNNLTHVFHYTLPDSNAYYTHRSGRTARAGKTGISLAFINGREHRKISTLEKQLGISFENVSVPSVADIAEIRIDNWAQQILETKSKGKINPELIEKAKRLFSDVSKEELIGRILTQEMNKLNLDAASDLNEAPVKESRKDSGSRKGYKGKRDFKRSGKDSRKKGGYKSVRNKKARRH
ncbi:MAG: DEAD/DEAH box helicase [Candidatus Cyclobacteriaceae bacterium M2_1C_046]